MAGAPSREELRSASARRRRSCSAACSTGFLTGGERHSREVRARTNALAVRPPPRTQVPGFARCAEGAVLSIARRTLTCQSRRKATTARWRPVMPHRAFASKEDRVRFDGLAPLYEQWRAGNHAPRDEHGARRRHGRRFEGTGLDEPGGGGSSSWRGIRPTAKSRRSRRRRSRRRARAQRPQIEVWQRRARMRSDDQLSNAHSDRGSMAATRTSTAVIIAASTTARPSTTTCRSFSSSRRACDGSSRRSGSSAASSSSSGPTPRTRARSRSTRSRSAHNRCAACNSLDATAVTPKDTASTSSEPERGTRTTKTSTRCCDDSCAQASVPSSSSSAGAREQRRRRRSSSSSSIFAEQRARAGTEVFLSPRRVHCR